MPSIQVVYNFTFPPSPNLHPPAASPTSLVFAGISATISCLGLLLSTFTLYRLYKHQSLRASARPHHGQTALLLIDTLLNLTQAYIHITGLIHHRVPNLQICLVQGTLLNSLCTSSFAVLSYLAYSRYTTLSHMQSLPKRHRRPPRPPLHDPHHRHPPPPNPRRPPPLFHAPRRRRDKVPRPHLLRHRRCRRPAYVVLNLASSPPA